MKWSSVGILMEITIIFQHAELCVRVGVCLSEQADRLLAGSVMIHGCFHVAYSC